MSNGLVNKRLFGCAVLLASLAPVFAADVFFGKATEVRSGEVVVVDYGGGQYVVRLIGIEVPQQEPIAGQAKQFVTNLALGNVVRARLGSRSDNGEMVSRLFSGDPGKDIGLELVRNGLARRRQGEDYQFGYKYGELSAAEQEARRAQRGLWAIVKP